MLGASLDFQEIDMKFFKFFHIFTGNCDPTPKNPVEFDQDLVESLNSPEFRDPTFEELPVRPDLGSTLALKYKELEDLRLGSKRVLAFELSAKDKIIDSLQLDLDSEHSQRLSLSTRLLQQEIASGKLLSASLEAEKRLKEKNSQCSKELVRARSGQNIDFLRVAKELSETKSRQLKDIAEAVSSARLLALAESKRDHARELADLKRELADLKKRLANTPPKPNRKPRKLYNGGKKGASRAERQNKFKANPYRQEDELQALAEFNKAQENWNPANYIGKFISTEQRAMFDGHQCYELEFEHNITGFKFYKIGITSRMIEVRVSEFPRDYSITVLSLVEMETKGDVSALESLRHERMSEFSYKPEIDFAGKTECFSKPMTKEISDIPKSISGNPIFRALEN